MPPVASPPADVLSVTVSKQQIDAAPVTKDPRDAKIDVLETTLQSLQSTLEKMQTTAASACVQQLPTPPSVHSISQQNALPAALSHETAVLPAESNRWMNLLTNQCQISAYNEPDAMCGFLFRMQQHNFENYQFAQQRTIERLEFENFMHLRQAARNNQTH